MPKTTTGIVLRLLHKTGEYVLTGPHKANDRPTMHSTFSPKLSQELKLHEVAHLAGLTNGYWLRGTPEVEERNGHPVMTATVWTWMQL